ncbi:CPBP family intramembrane metalloprotease [Geodermatophilaceae bacterium NBWT11]|nr:CPBP family intramembrane metalloprotease [Geodermatophilaceae bacterium NBWT11]
MPTTQHRSSDAGSPPPHPDLPRGSRRLSVAGWVGLVIGYLVLLQGLAWVLTRGRESRYGSPTSVDELWRSITVPVACSVALIVVVVGVLRWDRPVWTDRRPVQRWVAVVPVAMLLAVVAATDYAGLADRGVVFSLLLLASTLLVGFGEELMFRGVGLTVFRSNGFSEGKAALWSTVVFGSAHATNLVSSGPGAYVQVFVAALSGYFLYLVRRRSGGLLLPALVHGLWDFSLISGSVVPDRVHPGVAVNVLVIVVLAVLLVVRRHRIEPRPAPVPVPSQEEIR